MVKAFIDIHGEFFLVDRHRVGTIWSIRHGTNLYERIHDPRSVLDNSTLYVTRGVTLLQAEDKATLSSYTVGSIISEMCGQVRQIREVPA